MAIGLISVISMLTDSTATTGIGMTTAIRTLAVFL